MRPKSFTDLRTVSLVALLLLVVSGVGFAARYEPPSYPELKAGEQLMNSREWNEAEAWFYDFVKEHPRHGEALRRLGLIELRRPGGDAVRAVQYLERATEVEPENSIGLFLLGKAYEVEDRRADASAIYDKLIEMGPGKDNPPRAAAVHLARFNRGLFAALDEDYETARALFGVVLQREPQQAYATWEMSLMALDEKKYEEAIEWGRKAVNNITLWAPTEAWPYPQGRYGYIRENSRLTLSKALIKSGQPAEAAKLLEPICDRVKRLTKVRRGMAKPQPKAPLEGEPDKRWEDAPYYFGLALIDMGEKKQARKVLKSYSRQHPGDSSLKSEARDLYRSL